MMTVPNLSNREAFKLASIDRVGEGATPGQSPMAVLALTIIERVWAALDIKQSIL